MLALSLGEMRGVSKVDYCEAFAVGHDVAGMKVAMVEAVSVERFLHPLFRKLEEVVMPLLCVVVKIDELRLRRSHAAGIGEFRMP